MSKKQRLWDKGEALNQRIHAFTVGNDPEIDLNLVDSDVYGSAAHAKMLNKVGLLTEADLKSLLLGLKEILKLHDQGKISIPQDLEDCHTTIESFLVERCGEAGRRIHTGRSRNDQVLLVMRLYMRKKIVEVMGLLKNLAETFFTRAEENFEQPMPGYTHFQPAMPTTVGIWFHAFAEACIDSIEQGETVLQLLNKNPLGAGSGFGSTFSLNRQHVTDLLGFGETQRNSIDIQNSRGRYERRCVVWLSDIATFIEKFAIDLILYSTREYGLLSIPKEFTTGSSIMPQKHNPDVLELLRARAGKLRATETEIQWIIGKLPSHYHRDFQYTKEPVIRAFQQIEEMIPVLDEVVRGISINKSMMDAAMTSDLFATYDAFREVKAGLPFRDAYRKTAERVKDGTLDLPSLKSDLTFIIDQARNEYLAGKQRLQELSAACAEHEKALLAMRERVLNES